MSYTAEQYRAQLKALLPSGQAFPRERGNTLDALLDAMSIELARDDARADQLVVEAIPSTTTELLPDWERVAGLPDNCSGSLADTVQGRRRDLVAKLNSLGGQSKAYFIALAAQLGFTISIEEFRPFRAGLSGAGDSLTNGDWAFTWRVNGGSVPIIRFRAGQSSAGEPLASWGNSALECRFNQLKPAHTHIIFSYPDDDTGPPGGDAPPGGDEGGGGDGEPGGGGPGGEEPGGGGDTGTVES